jgi:type II secretory pathway pseudopilin PulG
MAVKTSIQIKHSRTSQGLTAIETVLLLFIIFVLGAIALPNLISGQDKAREAAVRANMRTTQIAAESFATDHGGAYPDGPSDAAFLSYLPGGNPMAGKAGSEPVNPYTNHAEPIIKGVVTNVGVARLASPETLDREGQVEYSVIVDSCGVKSSYAIRGTGAAKKTLAGVGGGTFVLSKQ